MKSPNKKKSKFGVKSTIGGELGGSYKTASPYNIKTMNMTNGLSPLMQAAVGGEEEFHTSGLPEVLYNIEGKSINTTTGGIDEGNFTEVRIEEETGLEYVEATVDAEKYKEGERLYLKDPNEVDPDAPGTPGEPGYEPPVSPEDMIPGGVGGPMRMASPYKNYKNPQDYKVFNLGNKPTPFEKRKKY